MGSGAGLNRGNNYLLVNCNQSTGSVTNPLSGYGTIGLYGNDSGAVLTEFAGFKAFRFQMIQVGSTAIASAQVSIYVTADPAANQTYWYAIQGRTPQGKSALPAGGSPNALADSANGFYPGIPATSWVLMDGLSQQSGEGSVANPITTSTQMFVGNSSGIIAIRAVITTAASAGTFSIACVGIP